MKLEDLPDFAKPFKKRGYDVRLRGKSYHLFKISSKKVEGKNYPVLIQQYIGVILEDGTLRKRFTPPADVVRGITYQEFGLSDFLYKRYHRLLERAIFNTDSEHARPVIILSIVLYVFGSISDTALLASHISSSRLQELHLARDTQIKRIERLCVRIGKEQEILLGKDKHDFELLMRLCVLDSLSQIEPPYPSKALEILNNHGVKP